MIFNLNELHERASTKNSLPTGIKKHFRDYSQESGQLSFDGLGKHTNKNQDNSLDSTVLANQTGDNKPAARAINQNLLGKITEIITSDEGSSNLAMLLPLLATLSKDDRWFAWVSPPKNLPKTLLKDAGIDLDKVMLLYPDDHNSALNLAKKALSAGTCHAVISWSGGLSEHELANLELSAKQGASHGILIRKRGK